MKIEMNKKKCDFLINQKPIQSNEWILFPSLRLSVYIYIYMYCTYRFNVAYHFISFHFLFPYIRFDLTTFICTKANHIDVEEKRNCKRFPVLILTTVTVLLIPIRLYTYPKLKARIGYLPELK